PYAAIAVVVTAIGLGLFAYSGIGGNQRAGFLFLQDIEQRTLDLRFALRGKRAADPRIVIVGIDDKTLQTIGSYPLPRSNYAVLVRQLKQFGARVTAFDVTFPTAASSEALAVLARLRSEIGPSAPAELENKVLQLEQQSDVDAQFADALKDAGNVVLGHLFLSAELSKFSDPKQAEAYFNIVWAKSFPQILKAKSGNHDFDLSQAWIQAGGPVAAGVEANLPKLAEAAASYGFFNIIPDADGTIRRALFVIRYQDQDFFPSLDLQVLRQYENIPDQQIAAYIGADGIERIQFGDHDLHPWQDSSALINYTGPYHSYPHYSMVDVIRGTVPADAFRDKIVFVGGTALGIGDLRNTPFEKQGSGYMGVEIHANILDNLLHSAEPQRTFLIRGFSEEIVDIVCIVFFGIGLGLWCGHSRPLIATLTTLVMLGAFFGFVYYGFAHWGRWYSFVVPAATLVASYASITSFRVIHEEREKRKIRKTFSQYLSPGVIALIGKDPNKYIRPGGEVKDLTVMFSDIRDFTTLSEGLTPDELVNLLNQYLSAMTDILFRNLGTLDKYIGDAIMAFWGSPFPQQDHAYRACRCALEMTAGLEELNRNWAEQGRRQIAIGIGLNTGPVNVGNMGSDKRLAWTVMGDNVNLASRLEGMTKEYRNRVIISESTYEQVAQQFVAREVDRIRVKGKKKPVVIYELLAPISERDTYAALLTKYNAALDVYRSRNWREAAGAFGELLAVYPDDGPTQILLQRCVEFFEEAPEPDWDGVYVMKAK
ncbi:MAG: adenylate/guanylate cyclase domain-containing protein, partial [Terriglobales bacterium]